MATIAKMEAFGSQDTGLVRENNEDRWLIDESLCVAIVADGMGGAACGEVAAAITVEKVVAYLKQPEVGLSTEQVTKEAIRGANASVRQRAHDDITCHGMGSTIVMAVWTLPLITIANVGDSRAYLWRAGELRQISYDQTLVNELRRSGRFTEEQIAELAIKSVLTMSVGSSAEVLIHTAVETLVVGDCVLLCSDGLWGAMSEAAIAKVLGEDSAAPETMNALIEQAKASGGEDNITVVLLRYSG